MSETPPARTVLELVREAAAHEPLVEGARVLGVDETDADELVDAIFAADLVVVV